MAELLVFTFLAAIAAFYSVLPKHRQLRVRYNLWTKPRLALIALCLGLIIATYWGSVYLQSLDVPKSSLATDYGTVTVTPLVVESLQLGAVLVIVLLIAGVFVKPTVRIQNEESMLSILRDLYNRDEYTTLINLIQNNYSPLIDHPPEPRRHDSLAEIFRRAHEDDFEPATGWRKRVRNAKESARYHLSRIRYWVSDTAGDASDYTETLFLDSEFSAVYPTIAPELGIRLIRDDSLQDFPRRKAVHRYLRTLVKTENSILYRNLEHNTATEGLYQYRIDEENRLLHALLSDFDRAETLDIYKPIGDATREIIRDQRRKEFDEYNDQRLTDARISDDNVFQDPVFVGIQFFDVMVKEAFQQKVGWHVWLSYYESFTREICRNYEITEYSDPDAEWPNDYSRLLSEMVGNMCDWLRMMQEEVQSHDDDDRGGGVTIEVGDDVVEVASEGDSDSEGGDETEEGGERTEESEGYGDHLELTRMSTDRAEANIPRMTAIILMSCHEEILTTEEVPLQFKRSVTKRILLCGVELRNHGEGTLPWKYSELLIRCLEDNLTGRRADPRYRDVLREVYEDVRHEVIVKEDVEADFVDELNELIVGSE